MPYDEELVVRVEAAECRLLMDSAEAVASRHPGADVLIRPLCGGVAVYTTPGSPLNKIAGLGFGGTPTPAEVSEVEAEFLRRHSPVQVEFCITAPLRVFGWFEGYEHMPDEEVMALRMPAPVPAGIERIEIVRRPDPALWIDTVVPAFLTPDGSGAAPDESLSDDLLRGVLEDQIPAPGFIRYLASIDGEQAGGASLKIHDGVAQLCGAATLPRYRRRGVQTALLHARLQHAVAAACDVAVVTVHKNSKAYENARRQGFEELYTRCVWVRT